MPTNHAPPRHSIHPHHIKAIQAVVMLVAGPRAVITHVRSLSQPIRASKLSPWQQSARRAALEYRDPRPTRRGWRAGS
ncbi:MAG: hypothetical protein IT432_16340 [Phycisphaerales bacterium]|nr:hypothetical protein [Phycisphaerales bacterium]